MNPYRYANSNPLIYRDPTGLLTPLGVTLGGACILADGAATIHEWNDVSEALDAVNAARAEIDKLEQEKSSCGDEARKAEIDAQIRALRLQRAANIVKATASGFGVGAGIAAGVFICPAVAAFF